MMYRDSEVTHFTKMSVAENKLVGNLFNNCLGSFFPLAFCELFGGIFFFFFKDLKSLCKFLCLITLGIPPPF